MFDLFVLILSYFFSFLVISVSSDNFCSFLIAYVNFCWFISAVLLVFFSFIYISYDFCWFLLISNYFFSFLLICSFPMMPHGASQNSPEQLQASKPPSLQASKTPRLQASKPQGASAGDAKRKQLNNQKSKWTDENANGKFLGCSLDLLNISLNFLGIPRTLSEFPGFPWNS